MQMTRAQFADFFDTTQLPALNANIRTGLRQKPMVYKSLFQVESSDRSIEQFSEITGTGLPSQVSENGEFTIDTILQGFDKTFRHATFGLGIEFTREFVEDDKFALMAKAGRELGYSVNEGIEIDAAGTFNNAFSDTGPDGVSLCSASHPLVKYGGLQSNILSAAADLDPTSLELALIDYALMRRHNGHQQAMPTPNLLIAEQNRFNAFVILNSAGESGTANNDANAIKGEGAINKKIVWSKLTDPDAWFLVAPPEFTGLTWIWRIKPASHGFMDDRNLRSGTLMRYRKSHGYTTYQGVYGTPGA